MKKNHKSYLQLIDEVKNLTEIKGTVYLNPKVLILKLFDYIFFKLSYTNAYFILVLKLMMTIYVQDSEIVLLTLSFTLSNRV